MNAPIALQLYTVRKQLNEDFEGTVQKIASLGYDGLETAGFPEGVKPHKARQLFEDLGLSVSSAHMPLPLGDDKNRVLDTVAALGCQRMICAYLSPEAYASVDHVRRTCDRLNEAFVVASENGFAFGLHNHWWEFQKVDGQYPFEAWLTYLDPGIFYELDTYWIQSAGHDPAQVITNFGNRVPLLHLKDGPTPEDTNAPMTALGEGQLDFEKILRASEDHVDWLIVELDRCATDMMAVTEKSLHYLRDLLSGL